MSCCPRRKIRPGRIVKGFAYAIMGSFEELSKERMKICQNCVHLRRGPECFLCGCYLDKKTRLPEETCPIDKWTPVSVEAAKALESSPLELPPHEQPKL